jgi:DnaJ-class molecular chaperone
MGQLLVISPQVEQDEWGPVSCALCNGDGETCNPGNADPAVKITDWLAPVLCPRCGGTGKDPNP